MVEAEGEVKESSAKLSRDPIGSKRIDKQNRIEDLPSQGIKRRGRNHRGIDDPAKGKRVRLRCLSIALSSSIVPYRANRPYSNNPHRSNSIFYTDVSYSLDQVIIRKYCEIFPKKEGRRATTNITVS